MQVTQNHQQLLQDLPVSVVPAGDNDGLAKKLLAFYQQLSADKLDQLSGIYSQDVTFIDPVTKHAGLQQLGEYFEKLLKGCTSCGFDIHDQELHNTKGWIRWTMSLVHPRLNHGHQAKVEGMSLVKIANNRITYQRDFYDMGEMIYENVPLLGGLIKFIRRRIA